MSAFEQHYWNLSVGSDASELGDGPGSYDISSAIWHVNVSSLLSVLLYGLDLTITQCCSPTVNGGSGWGFFNAIFGWNNTASYGSILSYNLYWLAVMLAFITMRYHEVKGHWPLMKPKAVVDSEVEDQSFSKSASAEDKPAGAKAAAKDEITQVGV